MQTESIVLKLLIAVFIIYLVGTICMLIDANTFFFDRLKGKAPWYLYMESGDLMRTYAQLKKTEEFVLGKGSGDRIRKKNKTVDEAQACALAAKANPEQFGCLSERKVLDAIFAARKMGVCVIVKANHFMVDYSADCKVAPIISRYQHKYLSFERFSDFVMDAQRYATPL